MGIFEKEGNLIDYTYLQKRGIIKKSPERKESGLTRTKDGFVDIGNMNIHKDKPSENAWSENKPNFDDLFKSMPQKSENSQNSDMAEQKTEGFVNLFDGPVFSNGVEEMEKQVEEGRLTESDMNAIKIKIEDIEYKLSNLLDKISLVESKLNNFEKKVFD